MVDKDFAEINALQKVFPESAILLCWYRVLQAVNRWLSKSESGVHGLSNTQKRNEIISFFCKLKACTSVKHNNFQLLKKSYREIQNRFLKQFLKLAS
uniref:Transposase n=1 Tax=Astatotilapia calliptera TaxID=8154 RepID=A0A3P8PCI2_ASTCA